MSEDKIIKVPGPGQPRPVIQDPEPEAPPEQPDVNKALHIVFCGMPYLLIGLRPTATGSDIFTIIQGDPEQWRKIRPQLSDVIDRAYQREGI